MKYLAFDQTRPFDLIALGRATVDFNPLDYFRPLDENTTFKKYLGGSPANITVGLARLGKKAGFIGKVSNDQFGKFVIDFFVNEGIDVSHTTRCSTSHRMGLTFTEILSEHESSIMMYRDNAADLQLSVDDVDEAYIKSTKSLLISGTSLCKSPSREAALKALILAQKTGTPVIFDIDYRPYCWTGKDEISIYYSAVAKHADLILGSREEYDLAESLIKPGCSDRETANYWMGQNAKIVIVKNGKKGSTAFTKDGNSYSIKPFPVKALKSFGGGDGYASALLFGLFNGWDIMDCLEFGSASASLLVASHGCSADMPDEKKVRDFIARRKAEYGEMVARGLD